MNDDANQASPQPPAGPPGLLTDDKGKRSMMRLMSFIALFASIWFAEMTITLNKSETNASDVGLFITISFLIAAFAPKALQKFIENSYPPKL